MASGNYNTISRKKILEYLVENSKRTVNVQDINHYLSENGYGVNITTIYRYLDKLIKEGSVMKYASKEGNQAVFQYVESASNCNEHLHLQCVKCGAICHLDNMTMSDFSSKVKDNHGFMIQCKKSIIYGLCMKCK